MLTYFFFMGGIILSVIVSLWLRCAIYRSANTDVKQSPLSLAVQELIAVAGGIYISLIMLISFIKLSIPERVIIAGQLSVDPLALTSLLISILQPFIIKFIRRLKRNANK